MRFIYQQVDASLADIREDLEQLQRDSLPADSLYFPEDATWWIAYHRHHPVAFACLCPSQQGPDGVYLGRCGVLPAFRGFGVQRRLIRLRLAWAKRQGYKWAVSDTTDNVPSANNLIACGFRLYTPALPYSFARALYWVKRL